MDALRFQYTHLVFLFSSTFVFGALNPIQGRVERAQGRKYFCDAKNVHERRSRLNMHRWLMLQTITFSTRRVRLGKCDGVSRYYGLLEVLPFVGGHETKNCSPNDYTSYNKRYNRQVHVPPKALKHASNPKTPSQRGAHTSANTEHRCTQFGTKSNSRSVRKC